MSKERGKVFILAESGWNGEANPQFSDIDYYSINKSELPGTFKGNRSGEGKGGNGIPLVLSDYLWSSEYSEGNTSFEDLGEEGMKEHLSIIAPKIQEYMNKLAYLTNRKTIGEDVSPITDEIAGEFPQFVKTRLNKETGEFEYTIDQWKVSQTQNYVSHIEEYLNSDGQDFNN